jgi:hypothetical protein
MAEHVSTYIKPACVLKCFLFIKHQLFITEFMVDGKFFYPFVNRKEKRQHKKNITVLFTKANTSNNLIICLY